MINLATATKPVVRETTAPFIVEENGEAVTHQIRVLYRTRSTKEVRDSVSRMKSAAESDNAVWFTDLLLDVLVGLPDICDEKKKPVKITAELLESFSVDNVNAIKTAIDEAVSPKSQTPSND